MGVTSDEYRACDLRHQAFEGFWALAGGLSLLAAVYLVTYWSGFRGGDRAMVRRPGIEGPVPASVAD